MAGLGRKVFTAGDVLTASDVQNYLMDQTVMYFAGTAARSSAIATPTTGMTTYIGTTGTATIPQIESYTGSAFQTLYGLTQVANVTFSAAASFSINGCFTTTYDNYLVTLDIRSMSSGAIFQRFRNAGVDTTFAGYASANMYSTTSTVSAATSGSAQIQVAQATGQLALRGNMGFFGPKTSTPSLINGQFSNESGSIINLAAGSYTFNDSFDGFSIFGTSITGTCKVYGLRNI